MARKKRVTSLLTLRIDARTARTLAIEARRRRTTKSELVRSILETALQDASSGDRLAEEARRQSLLVSRMRSEGEMLEFIGAAADLWDWK